MSLALVGTTLGILPASFKFLKKEFFDPIVHIPLFSLTSFLTDFSFLAFLFSPLFCSLLEPEGGSTRGEYPWRFIDRAHGSVIFRSNGEGHFAAGIQSSLDFPTHHPDRVGFFRVFWNRFPAVSQSIVNHQKMLVI